MNTTRSYQQVMLDHGRNPRNFGAPPPAQVVRRQPATGTYSAVLHKGSPAFQ